jgi:hypothetical protein
MTLIDWLFTPLSGAAVHSIPEAVAWHARLMTLAWGVIVPTGVLIARYWKIWPNQQWPETLDHKGWWHSHRFGQLIATGLMLVGVWLVWVPSRGHNLSLIGQLHLILGWSLMLCVAVQVVGGFLRGSKGGPTDVQLQGDHFDMTPRRRLFERIHKVVGWLSVFVAMATILLGLWWADAPRWMPLMLLTFWIALLIAALRWQHKGQCIDTYQAIWGQDPRLPGLRYAPIGLGVRRVGQNTADLSQKPSSTHAAVSHQVLHHRVSSTSTKSL